MKTLALILALLVLPGDFQAQSQRKPKPTAPPIAATTVSDQALAHEAVITFLKGIQISELPEGKEMLAQTQWILGAADYGRNFYSRPEYTESSSVFAGFFDTDIPSVRGYKELFELKATTKIGIARNPKLLVIAFRDATSGSWKILSSIDNGDDDPNYPRS